MSEEERKEKGKKAKISKLTVKSMMLAAIASVIFLTSRIFYIGDEPILFKYLYITIIMAGGIIAFTLLFQKKHNGRLKDKLFAGLSIALFFFSLVWASTTPYGRTLTRRPECRLNLSSLSKVLRIYSDDYKGKYPTADKWCDLLKDYHYVENYLVCPAHRSTGKRCSYAINPYCEPNSPTDTVLLFETKGGWNQFGGIELASTGNHPYKIDSFWGYKIRGCNILFNGGNIRFVREEEFLKLKWKPDEVQKE